MWRIAGSRRPRAWLTHPAPDLATAHAMIATLSAELTPLRRENASKRREFEVLCRHLYDKHPRRPTRQQLQLALEQLADEPAP